MNVLINALIREENTKTTKWEIEEKEKEREKENTGLHFNINRFYKSPLSFLPLSEISLLNQNVKNDIELPLIYNIITDNTKIHELLPTDFLDTITTNTDYLCDTKQVIEGMEKFPSVNTSLQKDKCNTCENTTHFSRIEVPYSYKLLTQELQTINVSTRNITD